MSEPIFFDVGVMAIGAAVTGGTPGSVLFVGVGPVLAQDNTALFWDAPNKRLGVGTATPAAGFDVVQAASVAGTPVPVLRAVGGAHTTITGVEAIDVDFAMNRTVQFNGGAAGFNQRAVVFRPPAYAATSAQSIGTAATVAITGPPVAGTNMGIATPLSLWVQDGGSKFESTSTLQPTVVLTNTAVSNVAHWLYMRGTQDEYRNSMIYLEQTGANTLGPGLSGSMIDIYKTPTSPADGEGITIQFNSFTTGMGFEMSHSGSGQAMLVTKGGAGGHGVHCTISGVTNGIAGFFERTGGTAAPVLEARQASANPALVAHPTAVGGSCAQFNDDLVANNTATRLVLITRNLAGGTGHCLEIQKIPSNAVAVGSPLKIQTGANLSAPASDYDLAGTGRVLRVHNGANEIMSIENAGNVLAGDGAQATPAFAFASDPDSGMWRVGANNLALGAGNAKLFEWNATQIAFFGGALTAQGAGVADPAGGAFIDAECRTALIALISRIEATSLIATV